MNEYKIYFPVFDLSYHLPVVPPDSTSRADQRRAEVCAQEPQLIASVGYEIRAARKNIDSGQPHASSVKLSPRKDPSFTLVHAAPEAEPRCGAETAPDETRELET